MLSFVYVTLVCNLMLSDSSGSGFILYRFGLTLASVHIVLDNAVCTRDTVVVAPPLVAIGSQSPHSRQRTTLCTPRPPCRCARTGSSAEFETDVENPGCGDFITANDSDRRNAHGKTMSTCRRCCQTVPRPSRAAHQCTTTSSTRSTP